MTPYELLKAAVLVELSGALLAVDRGLLWVSTKLADKAEKYNREATRLLEKE